MKAATGITMVICGILYFGEIGGNSVKLTPYPEALVKEGETLHLQCNYTGLSYPDFINWYLNDDPFGLVIDAINNRIQIKPKVYETERYTIANNGTSFTLSIANISQAKDDGDKWECDNTIIGMQPPSKASTVIRVIEADDHFSQRPSDAANISLSFIERLLTKDQSIKEQQRCLKCNLITRIHFIKSYVDVSQEYQRGFQFPAVKGTLDDAAREWGIVFIIVFGSLLPVAVVIISAVAVWRTRKAGTCKRDFCNTCQMPSEKQSVNIGIHATIQNEDC